jgi:hypothetical protein
MQNNDLTIWGQEYSYFISQIERYQRTYQDEYYFFQGGDDLNLLADYKSDVKFFNFRGYMGINPYEFSRGSSFGYQIDGVIFYKLFLWLLIGLFFL